MSTRSPLILLVEDDRWFAEQQERTLRQAGFEATIAPHAVAAIAKIDQLKPAVIVLDMLLVGSTGLTLLHELRSYKDLAMIPVILCTANARNLILEDLAFYGIKQLLDKTTMHPDDLVAAVRKVLV